MTLRDEIIAVDVEVRSAIGHVLGNHDLVVARVDVLVSISTGVCLNLVSTGIFAR